MIVKVNMIVVVTLVTPHNCVDGEIDGLSLNAILSFFMGADLLPPGGFEIGAEMWFDPDIMFLTASMCAFTLILPTKYHDNAKIFQNKMAYAIQNYGGFRML